MLNDNWKTVIASKENLRDVIVTFIENYDLLENYYETSESGLLDDSTYVHVDTVIEERMALEEEIETLKEKIEELNEERKELYLENDELRDENDRLKDENDELKRKDVTPSTRKLKKKSVKKVKLDVTQFKDVVEDDDYLPF